MSNETPNEERIYKPYYHMDTDLFRWHQYQGDNTNDCAAFSIAIVGNALLNSLHFDGAAVAREMEKPFFAIWPLPHVGIHKIPNWATFPWGISGYLQRKNIPAKLQWFGSLDSLLRNIQENRFTIVILGDLLHRWAHAKVLYGFEPTGPLPERGLYFVDPGYPREWSRPRHPRGVFLQDEDEFKQQWGNLFRLSVEVGA